MPIRGKRKEKTLKGPPTAHFPCETLSIELLLRYMKHIAAARVKFAAGNANSSYSSLISCFILLSFFLSILPLFLYYATTMECFLCSFSVFFPLFLASRRSKMLSPTVLKVACTPFCLLNLCLFSLTLSRSLYFSLYFSMSLSLSTTLCIAVAAMC